MERGPHADPKVNNLARPNKIAHLIFLIILGNSTYTKLKIELRTVQYFLTSNESLKFKKHCKYRALHKMESIYGHGACGYLYDETGCKWEWTTSTYLYVTGFLVDTSLRLY